MADKTIDALNQIPQVTDTTYIPVSQNSVAGKMNGAQFRAWAEAGASPYADAAAASAELAGTRATAAGNSATAASNSASNASSSASSALAARNAIENMGVASTTLAPGANATVSKTVSQQGVVTLTFGLPQGPQGVGIQGPEGPQGPKGDKGDTGTAVAVETQGMYYFGVDNDSTSQTYGHLFLTYTGSTAPDFNLITDTTSPLYGHLIWNV